MGSKLVCSCSLQKMARFFSEVGLAYQSPPPLYTSRPSFIFLAPATMPENVKKTASKNILNLAITDHIIIGCRCYCSSFGTQPLCTQRYRAKPVCYTQIYFIWCEIPFGADQ